jgi:hypothetical protein
MGRDVRVGAFVLWCCSWFGMFCCSLGHPAPGKHWEPTVAESILRPVFTFTLLGTWLGGAIWLLVRGFRAAKHVGWWTVIGVWAAFVWLCLFGPLTIAACASHLQTPDDRASPTQGRPEPAAFPTATKRRSAWMVAAQSARRGAIIGGCLFAGSLAPIFGASLAAREPTAPWARHGAMGALLMFVGGVFGASLFGAVAGLTVGGLGLITAKRE